MNDIREQTDVYLRRIKKGETAFLGDLYDLTSGILFSLCYSYFKNQHDSEDALHDAYLSLVKQIPKYSGADGFNWMFTITKNICLNIIKKNKRVIPTNFTDEAVINTMGADESSEMHIHDESGIFALSEDVLKEEEFRIVILHAVHGMKFAEIAKGLGKLEGTVRWRYNNAIKKVKTEFERRQRI